MRVSRKRRQQPPTGGVATRRTRLARIGLAAALGATTSALIHPVVASPDGPAAAQAAAAVETPAAGSPLDREMRWLNAAGLIQRGAGYPRLVAAEQAERVVTGTPRATLAREMQTGFSGRLHNVRLRYLAVLGRESDGAGLLYWAERLRRGTTGRAMEVELLVSAEARRTGDGSNAAWLDLVYRVSTGRPVDAAGQAHWTRALAAGTTHATVARAVRNSEEARRWTVRSRYLSILDRDPEPEALEAWALRLRRIDDLDLQLLIVSSTEHLARAQTLLLAIPGAHERTAPHPTAGPDRRQWAYHRALADDGATAVVWTESPVTATGDGPAGLHRLDRATGALAAVPLPSNLSPATAFSRRSTAALSADGSILVATAFRRGPDEEVLLLQGPDGVTQVVRDDQGAPITSAGATSTLRPSLSPDGAEVVVSRVRAPGEPAVVELIDLETGAVTTIADGDGPSGAPRLARDGSTVVFTSNATDLTTGGAPGPAVLVWDRATGAIERIASARAITEAAALSHDGRWLALLTPDPCGPTDSDGDLDVCRVDRDTGAVALVSDGPEAVRAGPDAIAISGDGELVAHSVLADPDVGPVLRLWRPSGESHLLSAGNTEEPTLVTGDGRTVARGYKLWPVRA